MDSGRKGIEDHGLVTGENSMDDPGFSSCEDDSDFDGAGGERENHDGSATFQTAEDGADSSSETKKPKFSNSQRASSNENYCRSNSRQGEALANGLILHRIFSHFKTDVLLSSVSLVCKAWNREARKFIHNYRVCSVRRPPGTDRISNCQFFRELDKLCCQMRQSRRPVPWNLLELNFSEFSKECLKKNSGNDAGDDYNDVIDKNMVDRWKVKYLELLGRGDQADCPIHKPILNFIRHSSSKLRRLKLKYIFQLEILFHLWEPHFPVLEEVTIFSAHSTRLLGRQKEIFTKLLDAAPKLKKIKYVGLKAIELIPEDKYGLLDAVEMQCPDTVEDDDLLWKIAHLKPALTILRLCPPKNSNSLPKFHKLLARILQNCHHSLESFDADSGYAMDQLSLLPLPNLTRLYLENQSASSLAGFWKTITSIDYSSMMPRLEEIEIVVTFEDDRPQGRIQWPEVSHSSPDLIQVCPTVRKLTLDLEVDHINLSLLKLVFPNVTILKFHLNFCDWDLAPLLEVWELYPNLEELKMKGEFNKLNCSYDSQFCGIFEEEAEWLRTRDEEYLKAVHIVPIRPSVLTMPNLRMLWIDLDFVFRRDLDNAEVNRLTFTSKVSEFVAFKRMKLAKVRVCGVAGFNDTGDLEDSDDEDEEEDADYDQVVLNGDQPDVVGGENEHSDDEIIDQGHVEEHEENNVNLDGQQL